MNTVAHPPMTYEEYAAMPGWRFSHIKEMDKSPLHVQHARRTEDDADHFRIGRALHSLVLEPDTFDGKYVMYAERRSSKAWDAFAAEHADKTILTQQAWDDAHFMADAVRRAVGDMLDNAAAEQVVTWTDEATGLPCKVRRDLLKSRVLADLKSTRDLDYRRFTNQAASLDYHSQKSFYAEPGGVDRCIIIAVEKSAPYDVGVFELDTEALDVGKRRWRKWLDRLAECLAADRWPGRYDSVQQFSLPSWATDVDNLFIPSTDEEVP